MASILAVDDSPSMRQLVAMTLRRAGHDVVLAEDGLDAIRVASDQDVDLVITDVHMPQMDGIRLIRELRGMPSYRFTPILVLTTESAGDMKMAGKEAGATGWIVKPFNADALLKVLDRVLEPARG
ncbi:response regulator [Spongiibacter taiwanensis]|uniref:response regulator n=1 Tax=Spongiibacter taiwanensis TaxID=1748242 RepID=UPI002034DDE0|nr:response regulator [Spongiibacter taiwanensis]USA42754.1 response regulator [Spongiibacter taiwanensis]